MQLLSLCKSNYVYCFFLLVLVANVLFLILGNVETASAGWGCYYNNCWVNGESYHGCWYSPPQSTSCNNCLEC